MSTHMSRSRWAAIGAAVAVTLGAGGIGITHATTSSGERPIYIPIEPCRLADNRPAGIGPDTSVTFDGWGTVGDCTLPANTARLALNVTAVGATQQTNLRFYPADAAVPGTANLNPTPGAPPTPNAVNVDLDAAGKFNVYNKFGTVAVVIDVMGYYDDHNHDDRYLQKIYEVQAATDTANSSAALGPDTVLASVTVKTPTSGRVILNSSVTAQAAGTRAGLTCSITSGTTVDAAASQIGIMEANNRMSVAGTRGIVVNSGVIIPPPIVAEHTYNLVCKRDSAAPLDVVDPNLTAIFVPDPSLRGPIIFIPLDE